MRSKFLVKFAQNIGPHKKMPRVFITILTYNESAHTLECLASLEKLTYENVEVIIVDNKSIDDSRERIGSYIKAHPKMRIAHLLLDDNYGFAGGNNRGIKEALKRGGDYVLILNPDTIVEPDFLSRLAKVAEHYKKKSKLAFFGPRILLWEEGKYKNNPRGARAYSNGGIIHKTFTKASLKDYETRVSELKEYKPFETDYVTGTCLLVPRAAIENIGLMREDYFLYYEDTDWSLRAKRARIERVIVPQSVIWHKKSATTHEFSYGYIYYNTRNGLYFAWWNGDALQKAFALLLALVKLAKQPCKIFFAQRRPWIKPISKGIVDFLLSRTGKIN